MKRTAITGYISFFVSSLIAGSALAAEGSFSTLTYNIAGLPQGFSSASGDRASATALISCYVKDFDFVNIQEDFNYHAALYDSCDDHLFRSPTSGGVGFGSGLNSLSRVPYMDWKRVGWNACHGVDCLTPKGFTMARVRLAEGIYIDIYNLHAQAQTEEGDLDARRKNLLQLVDYIEYNSAGNAIIVMGDTNTRYTRSGDNMWEFLRRGFTDVWIDQVRMGAVAATDAPALVCDPPVTSPECEVVDKVLVRDNGFVGLQALDYRIAEDAVDANGIDLSDHRPIAVNWRYSTADNRRLSDQFGGPHGRAFNDVSLLPSNPVVREVRLRTGKRVDRIETILSNGYPFGHGGTGGNEQTLTLAAGEYLSSVYLCSGKHNGITRIFSARLQTSHGRSLSGGTSTSDCVSYTAPGSWQIVAFHGRSGDEIDKLGVVYAPIMQSVPTAVTPMQIVNQDSGQCLDIEHAIAADGSNVIQWPCNGGGNQRWSYDDSSGLIRSMLDPHYCLDNSGSYHDGANIAIWNCNGNSNQRFKFDPVTGKISIRSYPALVVDASGSDAGDNIITWSFWGGSNQRWSMDR
jgi:hypothetical protein